MFLIKKLEFETYGVTVEIPEDLSDFFYVYWLDECSFAFRCIAYRYIFSYEVTEGKKEKLLKLQSNSIPVEEIEINGLKGHCSIYRFDDKQYYKARFLIGETEKKITQFVFTLWTKNDDIKEIKASPEFKKLLGGIRKKDITA